MLLVALLMLSCCWCRPCSWYCSLVVPLLLLVRLVLVLLAQLGSMKLVPQLVQLVTPLCMLLERLMMAALCFAQWMQLVTQPLPAAVGTARWSSLCSPRLLPAGSFP